MSNVIYVESYSFQSAYHTGIMYLHLYTQTPLYDKLIWKTVEGTGPDKITTYVVLLMKGPMLEYTMVLKVGNCYVGRRKHVTHNGSYSLDVTRARKPDRVIDAQPHKVGERNQRYIRP